MAKFAIKLLLTLALSATCGFQVSLGAHLDETEASSDDTALSNEQIKFNPVKYLRAYGYLTEGTAEGDSISVEALAAAIKQFQKFIGIEATGQMNNKTKEWIEKPRCGNADISVPKSQLAEMRQGTETDPYELTEPVGEPASFEASDNDRHRRHAHHSVGKWANKTISYRVANYPTQSSMSSVEVEAEIEKAFDAWAKASSLSFEKRDQDVPGKVDIEVKFVKDYLDHHGEDHAIANTDEPGHGEDGLSQMQLDDNHKWSLEGGDGTKRLLSVALHQVGHTIGMGHSHLKESAMFPIVREDLIELSKDDKKAIEAIYKPPKKSELREFNSICNRYPFIYEYFSPGPNFRTYYSCTRLGPVLRYCPLGLAWHHLYGYCDYAFNIPGFHYF